jgi:hypothetical protein
VITVAGLRTTSVLPRCSATLVVAARFIVTASVELARFTVPIAGEDTLRTSPSFFTRSMYLSISF